MKAINQLYPHLLPVDAEVWQQFLLNPPIRFDRFDYDVRIGLGVDPGDKYPPNYRKMCLDLSRMRIDAIGYTSTSIYIIEITRHAGLKALGQLTAYPTLYRKSYPTTQIVIPYLVCLDFTTDMQAVFDTHGLAYWTPKTAVNQNKPRTATIDGKGGLDAHPKS